MGAFVFVALLCGTFFYLYVKLEQSKATKKARAISTIVDGFAREFPVYKFGINEGNTEYMLGKIDQ